MTEYLKSAEVQELLGCHEQTLLNWRKRGIGPAYVKLPNGRFLYPKDRLEAWLEEHLHPGGGA